MCGSLEQAVPKRRRVAQATQPQITLVEQGCLVVVCCERQDIVLILVVLAFVEFGLWPSVKLAAWTCESLNAGQAQ